MNAELILWIGQSVAFVLFLTSEILGLSSCSYNSVFDAVWAFMKMLMPGVTNSKTSTAPSSPVVVVTPAASP
jgi:hypothetical protein